MQDKKFDLEDRLIDFGVEMIKLSESIDKRREASRHLSNRLIRSGTSPGIHYGEAQSAESRKDFIHKMKLILKELRETRGNLKMMAKANLSLNPKGTDRGLDECTQLIAIFVKSIQTAERNGKRGETGKQMNRTTDQPRN